MNDFEKKEIETLEDDNHLEKTSYKMNIPKFDTIEFPQEMNTVVEKEEDIHSLSTETVNKKNQNNSFKVVIIFIVILLVVFFLPNISDFFSKLSQKDENSVQSISTGVLKCSLDRKSDEFNYTYESDFSFFNNQLRNLDYTYTIVDDKTKSKDELKSFYSKCVVLQEMIEPLDGISVSCYLKENEFNQNQTINYLSINEQDVTSAYLEAGGMYPSFRKNQNINEIEKNMKSSGYSCVRTRS